MLSLEVENDLTVLSFENFANKLLCLQLGVASACNHAGVQFDQVDELLDMNPGGKLYIHNLLTGGEASVWVTNDKMDFWPIRVLVCSDNTVLLVGRAISEVPEDFEWKHIEVGANDWQLNTRKGILDHLRGVEFRDMGCRIAQRQR